MIQFTCGQCGRDLRAQERMSGKHMKCTGCGASVKIPPAPVAHSPDSADLHEPRLLKLREEIKQTQAVAEVKKDEAGLQFRPPVAPAMAGSGKKSRLVMREGVKPRSGRLEQTAKVLLALAIMLGALGYAASKVPAFSDEVDMVRDFLRDIRVRWQRETDHYRGRGGEAEEGEER